MLQTIPARYTILKPPHEAEAVSCSCHGRHGNILALIRNYTVNILDMLEKDCVTLSPGGQVEQSQSTSALGYSILRISYGAPVGQPLSWRPLQSPFGGRLG